MTSHSGSPDDAQPDDSQPDESQPGDAQPDEPQKASYADDAFHGPGWDEDGTSAPVRPAGSRKRRRVSRRRLRRRRRAGLVMLVAGGVIVLGGLWLIVTGLLARGQLDSVRAEVATLHTQIGSGDLDGARSTARQLAAHAHRADLYTTGPAWAVAAAVPAGGAPFATVRDITRQVDVLGGQVLPSVITATRELDPSSLRNSDGTIDLARIAAVAPQLHAADRTMSSATASVAAQPATTWLGFVDSARSELLGQMTSLGSALHSADLAARIAPSMLGQHGTKRYFVAFQNDAEARGTGGLPGAFAIVKVTNGKISFERFESDSALSGTKADVDFGTAYRAIWGTSDPTTEYVDSNVSPHFPYAAQIWLSMWHNFSGERLDGALAVDPQALSYLLAVTGPASLPDGTPITAGNVVALTQKDLYAKFGKNGNAQRKQYLLDVARAVSRKVVGARVDSTALVKAAGRAGVERRLLIYSTTPSVESDLEQTSLSGAVPDTDQPYAGLAINNAAGNKLDYYLDRSITWQRSGCGSTRDVTVTVRLTNDAPAALPPYVEERNDHPDYPTKPGDNREAVFYYATHGAIIDSVELDGKQTKFFANFERGHPVIGLDVELPRGATRTIVYHLSEPAGSGSPVVLDQPLVRPLEISVRDQSCG